MKKLVLATIAVIGLANWSYGQGEIQFFNTSSAGSKIFLSGTTNGQATGQSGAQLPGAGTTSYTFALFVNATQNTTPGTVPNVSPSTTPFLTGGWSFSGDYATNSALTGRIAGVDGGLGYEVVNVSGFGVGVNANVELIGWNTAIGGSSLSSFEAAYAAGTSGLVYGYSGVANVELGDNGATVANSSPFGATAGGLITGFTLAPYAVASTPEPTTIALAGLGGLALLGLRRKK